VKCKGYYNQRSFLNISLSAEILKAGKEPSLIQTAVLNFLPVTDISDTGGQLRHY
jgi:hypothetical protein